MSLAKPGYVRPLDLQRGRIDLTHGAGGRASHQLVQDVFQPAFARTWTHLQDPQGQAWQPGSDDGAVLPMPTNLPDGHRLVLATDAHVVSPLFFPGGNIGQLAVHGTVNDLAMMGATPLHLTASFILEEGLPLTDLVRIARSMADAACEAGVAIVTGDTKVVERGKGDGAYHSTTGLGWIAPGVRLSG
ncbi:MAG: AIR synthase related protein, partial [Aquabacterium sp.]|uniref:AIR synthase related protein n=1 Tax=Aquabacterium sp. TaxID=1872578 RepID=UPI002A35B4D9